MVNTQPEQTLLLIDGLNIVRRCYEANPADDSPEKAQATVRSSLGSFKRALTEHKPDYALAAFDFGGPTWRHELYPAYREKRKPMPQVLRDVLPQFKEQLKEQTGMCCLTVPGVEADDVLATAFYAWSKTGRGPATVMSTDKDLAALIADGARVRDHFTPEWREEAWVQKKFGVPARLLHDVLALMGDDVDGVPGVDKVGAKTAAAWLLEHGSLENLLAAAGAIKGKAGERLREQADRARISRQLVAFKTDIQLGLTWSMCRMNSAPASA